MKEIPDGGIDMILCDLPYGTTRNHWDREIDFPSLWRQYERVIKDNGCIALFAQCPFDKVLACSNLKLLRYEWVVEKTAATGHLNAKQAPMKAHENVLIFYKKTPTYNPQITVGHPLHHQSTSRRQGSTNYGPQKAGITSGGTTWRYPRDVIKFKWDRQKPMWHPTQKPVALLEYLIKTYTNPGDLVLDNCMGSGSTGVACVNTGRNFIGIELDDYFFQTAEKRISDAISAFEAPETEGSV